MNGAERTVFLCHASDDKEAFVRPFARELKERGITYWLDEAEVKWGDKITQKINAGLARARFVVVFLSNNFLGKNWPESELGAALNKENTNGETVVLPLLLGDVDATLNRYPLLRDKLYLRWSQPVSVIVDHLQAVAGGNNVSTSAPKDAAWDLEPTIADVFGETLLTEFGSDVYKFIAERKDLRRSDGSVLEIPLAALSAELPSTMQHFLPEFLAKHSERTKSICSAIRAESTSDGRLQIVSIKQTPNAEFDIMLRNLSDDTVYITRIIIRVLKSVGFVLPILNRT